MKWFLLGAFAGVAVMSRIMPANESSCCKRVEQGIRDQVGAACGPLSFLCQGVGDSAGIWRHGPTLLDLIKGPAT